MKTVHIGWKKIFSGICIAVFVAGHTFSVYSALHGNALFANTVQTPTKNEGASSFMGSFLSRDSSSSALSSSSVPPSAPESFSSVVPVSSVPGAVSSKAPQKPKDDPGNTSKPVEDDRNSKPNLNDTVPKKEVITPVVPYVLRVTGNKVRLRTTMSTQSDSNIISQVNNGHRLLCVAEGTAKNGSRWRQAMYDGKKIFISAQYSEATNEDPNNLNSKPQSSSSSKPQDNSSSKPDAPVLQGWQTISGKTYFYVNGQPVTGWQIIGGMRHLFDDSGVKISKTGVDVSRYQLNIDWKKVKEAGIDFAIIRVGYRGYETGKLVLDNYFEKNIKGATAAGIPCGVYIYSTAINTAEAIEEANYVLNAVKNYKLEYPIMYDVERYTDRCAGVTKKQFTDNTIAFLDTIKKAGYKAMYYTYRNFLQNHLEYERLKSYDLWLAVYSNAADDSPVFKYNYKIWQYSSSGKVDGIPGNADLNIQVKPV